MKVFIKRSIEVEMLFKLTPFPKLNDTACTLKLRLVKLLFVIFGRLSNSFFVHLMVRGNGRLSYLIF